MNLKEMKTLVKMNAIMGVETDPKILANIAREEDRLKKDQEDTARLVGECKVAVSDLLSDIGKLVTEEKQKTNKSQPKPSKRTLIEAAVEKVTETAPSMFVQPDPPTVGRDLQLIQTKLKMLEGWVSKISMTGPGGGEVNLRYLDDVARETIADGKWLKYDAARKKFVFDDINPGEVVNNTTVVTGDNYTVGDTDWYIGVNHAGPVTITLPPTATTGRVLIIKDESGSCETYPITALGTVDNDTGGFILQINNGAIQMTYRSGWRVI